MKTASVKMMEIGDRLGIEDLGGLRQRARLLLSGYKQVHDEAAMAATDDFLAA
jgi:hypothetical protein